jgi:hypothetical protein
MKISLVVATTLAVPAAANARAQSISSTSPAPLPRCAGKPAPEIAINNREAENVLLLRAQVVY